MPPTTPSSSLSAPSSSSSLSSSSYFSHQDFHTLQVMVEKQITETFSPIAKLKGKQISVVCAFTCSWRHAKGKMTSEKVLDYKKLSSAIACAQYKVDLHSGTSPFLYDSPPVSHRVHTCCASRQSPPLGPLSKCCGVNGVKLISRRKPVMV